MSSKYNLKHILKIEIEEQKLSEKYVYKQRSESKNWYGKTTIIEEGVYNIRPMSWESESRYYTLNEFKTNSEFFKYVIVDNQVFIKTIVTLTFVNKEKLSFYFETLDEANAEVKEITDMNDSDWLSTKY